MHDARTGWVLLLATLAATALASGPAAADHREESHLLAHASAEGSVDCFENDAGTEVVCQATAEWEGGTSCFIMCKARFEDATNATFVLKGPSGERSALGRDACGYQFNGCELDDTANLGEFRRGHEGCYEAVLEVHTVVNATQVLLTPDHDSAVDHFRTTDRACL